MIYLASPYTHVVIRPPKFNPAKNAGVKTLMYVVVQRLVEKYVKSLKKMGKKPVFDADSHGRAYRDAEPKFDQPWTLPKERFVID